MTTFAFITIIILLIYIIIKQKEMANSITELTAQVDELQTALDAEQEQIKSAIDGLQAIIDELRANQTDGGTAEERQALADKIASITTDLKGTIPDSE